MKNLKTAPWVVGGIALLVIAITVASLAFGATPSPKTEYSAVLMTNGNTYYGRLSGLGNKFPVMEDVFTITGSFSATTATESSVMTPRVNEFHGPKRTILNAEHIVFVESVASGSQVGRLIKKLPK